MAVTESQPVSTGNLSALLMSMAQGMDGFLERHFTGVLKELYSSGSSRTALATVSSSGVSASGTAVTLADGAYLMSFSTGLDVNNEKILAGTIIVGGGSYTFGLLDESDFATISIVQLSNGGGSSLLDLVRGLGEAA